MKFLVAFLAVLAFACGSELQEAGDINGRSISSIMLDTILAFQEQMPCGLPQYGIPVLAPLYTSHQKVSMNGESLAIGGEVSDLYIHGLDDFDIIELNFNVLLRKFTFDFRWNHVHLTTNYKMTMENLFGMKLDGERQGPAKFSAKEFRIWGEIRWSIKVLSGRVRISKIAIQASIGDVVSEIENLSEYRIINKMLNNIIEEWILLAINDNTDTMGDFTDRVLTPMVNDIMGEPTVGEIIGWITGGSRGKNDIELLDECVSQNLQKV